MLCIFPLLLSAEPNAETSLTPFFSAMDWAMASASRMIFDDTVCEHGHWAALFALFLAVRARGALRSRRSLLPHSLHAAPMSMPDSTPCANSSTGSLNLLQPLLIHAPS